MTDFTVYRETPSTPESDDVKVYRIWEVGDKYKSPDNENPIKLEPKEYGYIFPVGYNIRIIYKKDELPMAPADITPFIPDDYANYNINEQTKYGITSNQLLKREEEVAKREKTIQEKRKVAWKRLI